MSTTGLRRQQARPSSLLIRRLVRPDRMSDEQMTHEFCPSLECTTNSDSHPAEPHLLSRREEGTHEFLRRPKETGLGQPGTGLAGPPWLTFKRCLVQARACDSHIRIASQSRRHAVS